MVLEFCFLRKDSISKEEARISIDYLLGSLEKKGKLLWYYIFQQQEILNM